MSSESRVLIHYPLVTCLDNLTDPREEKKIEHPFITIVATAFVAIMCDCNYWDEIEEFVSTRQEWFSKWLEFPNGVPSHDTYNRVFREINPKELARSFERVVDLFTRKHGEAIAIDGKTARRSFDTGKNKHPLHLVSAWAQESGIVLGQVKTSEKSNEITAIPELLDLIDLKNGIVTIDAMGCQAEIAAKIREKKADYILAVKENQKKLYDDISEFFVDRSKTAQLNNWIETVVMNDAVTHGRSEKRTFRMTEKICRLSGMDKWTDAKTAIEIQYESLEKGELRSEQRLYLSSAPVIAKEEIAKAIRGHWGIENKLHWVLDMSFREDECRKRTNHSPQNFAVLRRMVLNIIRKDTSKGSMSRKRKRAGWSMEFLEKLLSLGQSC